MRMQRPHAHPKTPSRHLPGTVLLVLALLWAQLLGLVHGVLHVHAGHAPAVQAQPAPQDLLSHLLSPAGDESECRLYDQLGQGGLLPQLPLAPALAQPLVPAWVVLQALQPRPCAAFAARAPPSFR